MKFVKLNSRGGDYLVVLANVAWLRTADWASGWLGFPGASAVELEAATSGLTLIGKQRYALRRTAASPGSRATSLTGASFLGKRSLHAAWCVRAQHHYESARERRRRP